MAVRLEKRLSIKGLAATVLRALMPPEIFSDFFLSRAVPEPHLKNGAPIRPRKATIPRDNRTTYDLVSKGA